MVLLSLWTSIALTEFLQTALPQAGKLKNITTWLSNLRRSINALNQCVDNCTDENSARTQMTDVFDPLLALLTGLLKFQRTYVTGTVHGLYLCKLPC